MPRLIVAHKTSETGLRENNEDVERICMNISRKYNSNLAYIDFFVICDGHGGSDVAEYVAQELERKFTHKNKIYPLSYSQIVKEYNYIQQGLISHQNKIAETCGSTALVVIRYIDNDDDYIQVINLGDCRAVLSRGGLALPLSKDHKPFWSDEKKRIDRINKKYNTNNRIHYDAGDWRIGDLSVSRSFGDLDNTPYLTHMPETFKYKIEDDDDFIIMACDGLWDVLQNHEAVNFVRDHWQNNNTQYYDIPTKYPSAFSRKHGDNIAGKLASYAIARGSTDNVSILILFFKK